MEWNVLLRPMDEIMGMWPQFSFDSDMFSEFHVAGLTILWLVSNLLMSNINLSRSTNIAVEGNGKCCQLYFRVKIQIQIN